MTAHLLIVDDDEFYRSVTQEVLEQSGYTVESAEDGLSAWERINQTPSKFNLILLDKQMPRLDGIELLKRIKSDERFKELPVIMLTADNSQENIIEGLAEGAFYYLTKPSTEVVLKLVIKNALSDFLQKRELRILLGLQANHFNLLRRAEFCIQTLQDAQNLALLLAEVSMNPNRTVSGYSELLINAIEHGNLGISYTEKSQLLREDRWANEIETRLKHPTYAARVVNVTLEKTTTASIVTITDQGDGFNWPAYLEFSPERVFDLHGRGIAMSKATSFDKLEYLGKGNSVVTTVRLPSSI
ncbi:MAG: response regulator [Gallionellaceae bacterium]|nr:MAG: response regulator [Gallionellaceae bacterium]